MKFKFPLLKIKVLNETIVLKPYKFYKVKYEKESRLVILYNLTYTNDKETLKSIIPYYISDGATNCFRANMLYPFICIQDLSQTEDCPQVIKQKYMTGLVFKYRTIKNINFDLVEKEIDNKLKEKFGLKVYYEFEISNYEITKRRVNSVGVKSVLNRLENLLDFMLAISSERIINDYPIEQYRPNYNLILVKFDKPEILPDPFDFTKNMLSHNETEKFLKVYDEFRLGLLTFFRIFYENFIYYKIFENEFIELESTDITLEDFNKLDHIKICKKPYTIDREKNFNAETYLWISLRLDNMIKKYINSIPATKIVYEVSVPKTILPVTFYDFSIKDWALNSERFGKDRSGFFSYIKKFLTSPKKYNPTPILPELIRNTWQAECKKKYLKYKNKYLQLKNKLF